MKISEPSILERRQRVLAIIHKLRAATKKYPPPMALVIQKEYNNDPYLILISTLLSLRARDTVTLPISRKLFGQAQAPQDLLKIPIAELEKIIYPLGFYRQKARTLRSVSQELITRFAGKTPDTEEELLSIKGIGRKTANLVLGVAFNIPALCVDTHVHRLANQFGLVHTKTPEQTERELQKIVPKKYWIELNKLLVTWGQHEKRSRKSNTNNP